ncbi:MAG: hypothetical protein ACJ72V_16875 [Nitrososphaeraceae archaeon]
MDKDRMLKTMTDEQIDHWFKVADETTAEYGVFLKVIMEDLRNPDTPQIPHCCIWRDLPQLR